MQERHTTLEQVVNTEQKDASSSTNTDVGTQRRGVLAVTDPSSVGSRHVPQRLNFSTKFLRLFKYCAECREEENVSGQKGQEINKGGGWISRSIPAKLGHLQPIEGIGDMDGDAGQLEGPEHEIDRAEGWIS